MKRKLLLAFLLAHLLGGVSYAQLVQSDSLFRRYYVGTSAFVTFNLLPIPNPPDFYQLNAGYWLTKRDVLSVEAITWTYRHPLGIPYGPDYESDSLNYPGRVQAYGLGLAYQHFWWKGLYTQVHATPFLQKFKTTTGEGTKTGFQLFTVARLGYHFAFWKNHFFIEPSVACTYWPINTGVPEGFKRLDRKYPSYFLMEPGFHVGYKF
ncbi:hypothetical protein WDZ92_05985 [Nostoc sp. NIES-2111]